MKEEYYTSFRDELLARRERILSLTQQSKIKGDYSEALVREFVRKHISSKYKVGHGLVYDDHKGKPSCECDVIVFERVTRPLFESKDLVIVNPDIVKFVMQVKSTLTSKKLEESIYNLNSVKQLNNQVMCAVVAFETNVLLKTLYFNAWRSKAIQFLLVFKSIERKRENHELVNGTVKGFIEALRHYGGSTSGLHGYSRDLIIGYDNENKRIALTHDENEADVKKRLSEVFKYVQSVKASA